MRAAARLWKASTSGWAAAATVAGPSTSRVGATRGLAAGEATQAAPSEAVPAQSSFGFGRLLGLTSAAAMAGAGYFTYAFKAKDAQDIIDKRKGELPEVAIRGLESYVWHRGSFEEKLNQFQQPFSDKLLPDKPDYDPRKTLVLDLEDTLVHAKWTRRTGWKTYKRPGVDLFLREMSKRYEIVVYTDKMGPSFAAPMMALLDPEHVFVPHRLYKEATLYESGGYLGGNYMYSIERLNRDVKKVIHLTPFPERSTRQENVVRVDTWQGEPKDTKLVELIPFLEELSDPRISDARQVVASFKGKDIPAEYKRRKQLTHSRYKKRVDEDIRQRRSKR